MEKTYCGWTSEEINEADYVPVEVMIAYSNDDWDGSDEWD